MIKLLLSIQLVILISFQVFPQTEWQYLGLAGTEIRDIEIDGNGNIYVAVFEGAVYKSTDNGVTWELRNNGIPPAIGRKLTLYNTHIYLATNVGLYKTIDGADNWFRIAQGIPFTDFSEVNVITNGYIFTSVFNMGTGGVFRSTDEGVTWESTSYIGFGALDIGINSNGVMFLGNYTASWYGIQRSFDLGMNWEWIIPYIAASALEYLNDGSVLAGAEESPSTNAGIYKSTNNGNTWFNTNTFNDWNNHFTDLILDTNDDIYVSVGGTQLGVYLSTDSGGSWGFKGLSNVDVICLAIDSSGYLYAGTGDDGIFRTPGRTTPVELVSFTAGVNERDVELSWITATELNNSGFEILRCNEINKEWQNVGYVAGFGTTTEPKSYSFVDSKVGAGNYTYRLKQIDFDGTVTYSEEVNVEVEIPLVYSLEQNYPNPFNPSTAIKYSLSEDGFVKLAVYNLLGEEVTTLVNNEQKAGRYEVNFNAKELSSGIYIYRLESNNFLSIKKMILIK